MKKANTIATLLVAVIAVLGVTPYTIAGDEYAQLEFIDFYPASLSYGLGEELAIACYIWNSGTKAIEDATVSLSVLDPKGACVYSFDYEVTNGCEFESGSRKGVISRHLWEVDENATSGKYTLIAILRWGSQAIQKSNFFYVPEEPEQTEPGMKITSFYTQRLVYPPGDNVTCSCRIKNEMNDNVHFYISMCLFDINGTMINTFVSRILSLSIDERDVYHLMFPTSVDQEQGLYSVEAILWWDDKATSKTAKFGIDKSSVVNSDIKKKDVK
jgi:uncharacterized protein YfaS (alpha-2-macroglobulin family)